MIKGGEGVLKRFVQLFFIITGGTLGVFFIPELIQLLNLQDVAFLENLTSMQYWELFCFSLSRFGLLII